ncbi:unnamed protein product [Nezara viridula]|uniref:Uncharacterized protein n=1 Tax=Nezara viridula TaxID=85310 RepID=A0A9P0HD40_NEZVI|nr:unnamed protein product [Nezara viridula]
MKELQPFSQLPRTFTPINPLTTTPFDDAPIERRLPQFVTGDEGSIGDNCTKKEKDKSAKRKSYLNRSHTSEPIPPTERERERER